MTLCRILRPAVYSFLKYNYSKMPGRLPDRLVWLDMELTGLEPTCKILEVGCVITEGNLDLVEEGPRLVIHQPESVLESMNDWCVKHHALTGLTEDCRKSTLTLEQAEVQLYEFVSKHTPPGKCQLAGNTVFMDKKFLAAYMPLVDNYLHYRVVDVSTIKELCARWYPNTFASAPMKQFRHRTLEDIRESIQELKFYREQIFVPPSEKERNNE